MTLDELLIEAGGELDQMSARFERSTASAGSALTGRESRRRIGFVLAGTLAIAGLVGLAAVVMGPNQGAQSPTPNTPPATSPPAPTAFVERLFFPPDDASTSMKQVMATPMAPTPDARSAGAVVAPSGKSYGITVSENYWGGLPSDLDQHDINGRAVAVSNEDGSTVYTSVNPCAMVGVTDMGAGSEPWSVEATTLLSALSIQNGLLSMSLPPGWTNVGSGLLSTMYGLTYDTNLNGTRHSVSLMEMVGAPLGALLAQSQWAPMTPTSFPADQAWSITPPRSTFTFLGWQVDGVAVLLGADHATLDELNQLASSLKRQKVSAWAQLLTRVADKDVATSSSVTFATQVPTTRACGPRRLSINR